MLYIQETINIMKNQCGALVSLLEGGYPPSEVTKEINRQWNATHVLWVDEDRVCKLVQDGRVNQWVESCRDTGRTDPEEGDIIFL